MNTTSIDNLKCIFCGEVFDDKEVLQEHFRKHGDPTFDKTSKSKQKVQNEVPTSTEKTEENELVGCDVCEEVFPTISKAITHKHKVHPDHDAKYFCPWCGKLFTMKHLYNKHLQTNHNDLQNDNEKGFHCDSCSVIFYIPSAMLHHNKFFHRQDTDLNSIGSSKKVQLFNQELIFIFYCPFCGEEYNNKVNLYKHMEDDHEDENKTPEDILRCPLCEAFFYHLDAYELHLTFHSSEDLYSEQNDLVNEITEFSLEAVPPILEKVEDAEIDTVDNFLETILDAPGEVGKVKAKKHKKHKKSKKESITLDEFLNMNKDVFGDGLNVQGIEEVPTQMVLKKKVKGKKTVGNTEANNLNADLSKLKKHGIIIKAKSSNKAPLLSSDIKQSIEVKKSTSPIVKSDPNDVISKLLRQGNNQIKIVKKSVTMDSDNKQDSYQSNKIDSSSDYDKTLQNDSQTCTKVDEDTSKSEDQVDGKKENEEIDKTSDHLDKEDCNKQSNIENIVSESCLNESVETDKTIHQVKENENTTSNLRDSTLKTLHSIGSQLTIKSLNQPQPVTRENEKGVSDQNDDDDNCNENINVNNDKIDDQNINTNSNDLSDDREETSVDALKKINSNKEVEIKTLNENHETKVFSQEKKFIPHKSLEALKNLSKCITIKTSSQSMKSSPYINDLNEQEIKENESDNTLIIKNKNTTDETRESSLGVEFRDNNVPASSIIGTNKTMNSQTHADILKRLPNVTARPISASKNIPVPNLKSNLDSHSSKTQIPNNKSDNEIEILHIDDSDSDADTDNVVKVKPSNINKPIQKPVHIRKNAPAQAPELNKNVTTFKSTSKQTSNYTECQSTSTGQESKTVVINRSFQSKNVNIIKSNNINKLAEEHKHLQNTIKNLRRHITIKPKNEDLIDDSKQMEAENDQDSDSSTGRVKITELNETSDTEQQSDEETRPRVESPHDTNSDNEENINGDPEDELSDIESKMNTNPIKNTKQNIKASSQSQKSPNLSFLNKEITIKPLKQSQQSTDDETNSNFNETQVSANIPVKTSSFRPVTNHDKQISKNVQTSQKTSTSSNQVSTVKTIKTYQSQTVIEEVTTTVTKTIRTVNTQEVQNASQNRQIIRPQKLLNKPVSNIIGTAVRHNSPAIGTKVRNTVPTSQIRPNNMNIRPSNIIAPARPRLNGPRIQNSPNIRKSAPTPQNKPRFSFSPNTPLKIAPNVPTTSTKRPLEEASGHFSCFKKTKESLIPDDIPIGQNESVQYSASQSSSSFTNVTKIVKGNNVATTQQTKSEASTSQKQTAKLSGNSGIKIVKTNVQQKQVEEKCETNSPKNSTLAALEKLQRQGLLIKKPRIEMPETEVEDENLSHSGSEEENFDE